MDRDDIPDDVWEEHIAERRARARMRHWCSECHGHTGPGSPCAEEPPESQDQEEQEP